MSYYENLLHDAHMLGAQPPHEITSYLDLHHIVKQVTKNISSEHLTLPAGRLCTEFGNRALFLVTNGVKFNSSIIEDEFCPEAEWRLADAMMPEAVANPEYRSPVIVTNEVNEPVGIIKRYGTRGLYGLRDEPHHNIVAHCFHEIDDATQAVVAGFGRGRRIHHMHAEEIISQPVRLSSYAIPLKERERLIGIHTPVHELGALEYDHDEFAELATQYLKAI